ncbi:2-hydroxyacid dehydrogenase [Mycoplasma sp. E35C]|uniref:2-hydroxyacid dehydrogenase n=1 Tax=Mycoplasma sp. E35C TaxID=2801918 RepID=UPI001CA3B579|nr:2-hydroxyacid dehydrogenase [Mycoplasma sp. E35C]QZX49467.1 lactate dehydrogenase [Mycoplasma sp. E35C]
MKVICFGVREVEKPFFEKFNKGFNYQLTLRSEALSKDNVELIKGHDAVICRASDKISKEVLDFAKANNINYVLTRTVGYDHIDIAYAKQLGIKMARVPSYSPTAISEVAVSMAIALSRKIIHFSHKATNKDFRFDGTGFAKELKNSVVGILGTGKIGYETAKMFAGIGAKVIGFDPYINEQAKSILEYKSMDEVIAQSDILSVHIPFIKNENEKMINDSFINKMKDGAILINCSRGQLQDDQAILKAIKSNKLYGAGLDVLYDEKQYFGKQLEKINDPVVQELIDLYPRVLITPHIGSYTDEAVSNMVEISYQNLKEYLDTKDCKNKI